MSSISPCRDRVSLPVRIHVDGFRTRKSRPASRLMKGGHFIISLNCFIGEKPDKAHVAAVRAYPEVKLHKNCT